MDYKSIETLSMILAIIIAILITMIIVFGVEIDKLNQKQEMNEYEIDKCVDHMWQIITSLDLLSKTDSVLIDRCVNLTAYLNDINNILDEPGIDMYVSTTNTKNDTIEVNFYKEEK